jgi:hypothetical protein
MSIIQSIDPAIGYYIAGFVDGEGSFNLKFRPRPDFSLGWKVSLTFNVSQKDEVILALIKRHIGCGTIFQKGGGVWMYEVNNLKSLHNQVIPFFRRFGFLSAKKKRDFQIFCDMSNMFLSGSHLTCDGVQELLKLRRNMNDGGKRKFSEEEILASLRRT